MKGPHTCQVRFSVADDSFCHEQLMVSAQQAYRAIELDMRHENIELQVKILEEKMTGTDEEKEILKRVLASSACATQIADITKEKEMLIARARAVETAENALLAHERDMQQRETTVSDLEKSTHAAIEKATMEQETFEANSAARMKELGVKEEKVTAKLRELKTYEGDESKIEAILELKRIISDKEKVLQDKDKIISKLEKEIQESMTTVRDTVDALVDKATENLVKEMTAKEDKIEKREELVSAQSSRLEADMAKIQQLGSAEKMLKDAEIKMKRANEQLAINNKREEELLALAKQLDHERDAIRKHGKDSSKEEVDNMATAFDHRVRGLHQQVKALKENEKQLNAKIVRLEAGSRRAVMGSSPVVQGRPKADVSSIEGWDSRFLDPGNPTKDELSQETARLRDVHKELESKAAKLMAEESEHRSSYMAQLEELKVREQQLDEQQMELTHERESLASIAGDVPEIDNISPGAVDDMRQKLQGEIAEIVSEYQNAMKEHRVKLHALQEADFEVCVGGE